MEKLFVGIDLGGTNIKVGLFDDKMNLLQKDSCSTRADMGPEMVVERIGTLVEGLFRDTEYGYSQLIGAGLGTPGPVKLREGVMVAAPNLPAFRNTPMRKMVRQRLEKPIVMENDANAACWGEHMIGAGKGVKDMVFITLGTGVGGGLISNGEIVHGYADDAAELGHMIIYPDGRLCGCGQRGCVEAYASAGSTALRTIEAIRDGGKSSLSETLDKNDDLTCKEIYDAANAGDELCIGITEGTARALGLMCVNLFHFSGPRRIVFAGGMIAAGDLLLKRIQYYFDKYIWPMKEESIEICFATLGEEAGLVGNAALVKHILDSGQLS